MVFGRRDRKKKYRRLNLKERGKNTVFDLIYSEILEDV